MKLVHIYFFVGLIVLTTGCSDAIDDVSLEVCNKKTNRVLRSVERGDLQALKNYLKNGGDPEYSCVYFKTGGGRFNGGAYQQSLSNAVMRSQSYELMKYYLTYPISSETKNEMLCYYDSNNESPNITELLILKGAHVDYGDRCYFPTDSTFYYLKSAGYNLNWVDPEDGNTLFMNYCSCPAIEEETQLITLLKLLIEMGAKTDLKNKKGQTALDQAKNPKIKEFLRSI